MNYVSNFELYLKTDKNASVNTISGYVREINEFIAYEGTPEDLTQVQPSHIRQFAIDLDVMGRARSTINRKISALKTFFKYLHEIEEVIPSSPADKIKNGKREKSLPKAVSEDVIMSLINQADRLKDRLIVELLYGLGGRASEVASLRVESIDFDSGGILLDGKGSIERMNPIHPSCLELIRTYMRRYKITSGWLFPNRLDHSRHMNRQAINYLVNELADKAGVDRSLVSPHVFRHSFATHMLENGCDMAIVQEFLGHADIATTKIYARVSQKNKKETLAKFHPLANLSN